MAYTGNPSSTLTGDCATVQLYSPTSREPLEWISVGEKGALANWWHVVTIDVAYDPATDANTMSYAVIDQMLSGGPSVSESGKITGGFPYNLNSLPVERDEVVTSTKIQPGGGCVPLPPTRNPKVDGFVPRTLLVNFSIVRHREVVTSTKIQPGGGCVPSR